MTKQEIFNKVWDHFIVQGNPPAYNPGNDRVSPRCYYRGPGGGKCAVGCLIPDELYKPSMEGKSARHILATYPLVGDLFGYEAWGLLDSMQRAHDQIAGLGRDSFRVEMGKWLLGIAYRYYLKVPNAD